VSREEAIAHALHQLITGKEEFFALVSKKDFAVHEALHFSREKDGVEETLQHHEK